MRPVGSLIVLLVGVTLLLPVPAAWADRGVAVDVGRIDVEEVLHPGQRYTLPSVGVRNPGSQRSSYDIGLSPIATEALAVPDDWLVVTPAQLTLGPGERARVEPVLEVPADAPPGTYETLLAAQLASDGPGARVGAAAATFLTFTVDGGPPSPPDAGGIQGGGWLLALLLAGLLIAAARRLRGLRIRIERRP